MPCRAVVQDLVPLNHQGLRTVDGGPFLFLRGSQFRRPPESMMTVYAPCCTTDCVPCAHGDRQVPPRTTAARSCSQPARCRRHAARRAGAGTGSPTSGSVCCVSSAPVRDRPPLVARTSSGEVRHADGHSRTPVRLGKRVGQTREFESRILN